MEVSIMNINEMSVREYNEMLKKQSKLNEEASSEITTYSDEDFNKRTEEQWDEFEGLCRQPTQDEIDAWRARHGK